MAGAWLADSGRARERASLTPFRTRLADTFQNTFPFPSNCSPPVVQAGPRKLVELSKRPPPRSTNKEKFSHRRRANTLEQRDGEGTAQFYVLYCGPDREGLERIRFEG